MCQEISKKVQRFCSSSSVDLGRRFVFSMWRKTQAFQAAGVRVPKWRERRHYAGRAKANIHASSAVSPSPSAAALLIYIFVCY